MKRIAPVLGGAAFGWAMLTAGSAMIAGQTRDQLPLEPGKMSLARVLVVNEGQREAIPVSWAATAEAAKVQIVGTPAVQLAAGATVQLAGTPTVQARATRQTWEYRQLTIVAGQDAAAALNTAGNDGWETTGVTLPSSGATVVILKRPR